MCGIAGYFGVKTIAEPRLKNCLERMRLRGPDAQKSKHFRRADGLNVYLLHSRLSIIDQNSRSDQPMTIGNHTMIFNGEVYNFKELREILHTKGITFTTTSDTEVLLRAIMHWGVDEALKRCEGMWALAVYDQTKGSLVLSRDRFGEKPAFIRETEDGIYFASEIKFIEALSGERTAVNTDHILRFLVNGYKSLNKVDQTFVQDIHHYPAGHISTFDPPGCEYRRRYWNVKFAPDPSMSYSYATKRARELLLRSVQLRMRSDVPIAFCLSGGVDSNGLVGISKRHFEYDVHGFTILNEDERYNETPLVETSVRELGIQHTAISVQTKNFMSNLRALVRQHDGPVYTITYYAHWLLQQSIADKGYRISISGTAADEIFSGYFDHHLLYLASIKDEPDLFQQSAKNWEMHIKPIVRNPLLQSPYAFIENPKQRGHIYFESDVYSSCLKKPWSEPFHEQTFCTDLLRNRMLNEMFSEIVPQILHLDDLNAMSVSVENRSPYLDRNLFEFLMTVPTKYLIKDGAAKSILRDALRGYVPEAILDSRRKVGFNAPIFSFLDVQDKNNRAQLLDDSPIFELVDKKAIEKLINSANLLNSQSKFLFSFICCKMFMEEFTA